MAELYKAREESLSAPAAAIDLDKTTLNDLIDKYVDPDHGHLKNCKDQVNMQHHISFWREQLGKQLISWTDAKGKSYWPSKIREVANQIEKPGQSKLPTITWLPSAAYLSMAAVMMLDCARKIL